MSEKDYLMKCSRSYAKIKFIGIWFESKDSTAMTEILQAISQNINAIELEDVNFPTQQVFREFLGSFPNLKKLLISESDLGSKDNNFDLNRDLEFETLILKDVDTRGSHRAKSAE